METRFIVFAIFSNLLFGLNFVVSKIGVATFPPFLFCGMRFGILIPFIFLFPRPNIAFHNLFILAILIGCVHLAGVNLALHLGISSNVAVLVNQSGVFLTLLLSIFFLNDRLTKQKLLGLSIGLIGIYFICKHDTFATNLNGFIALFAAVLAFSISMIVIKKTKANAFHLILWLSVLASPILFLLSFFFENNQWEILQNADLSAWSTVFFAGWGTMFMGAYLWLLVIKKYDLSIVLPYRLLIPLFGSFFAFIILDEHLTRNMWIGICLICLGLLITQKKNLRFRRQT